VPPIAYKLRSLSDLPGAIFTSGWDTNARSTCIGIGIGRCVYSNTRIGSYRCARIIRSLIGSTLSEGLPEGHEGSYKLATHGNAIQPKLTQ